MLTDEVKYLVENFWKGLRCNVMVPCVDPCGKGAAGTGLFEVEKLIDSKHKNRPEYPCPVCNEWQIIDHLLHNASTAQPEATEALFAEFGEVKQQLVKVRQQLALQGEKTMGRFDQLDKNDRRILSRVDHAFTDLMQALTDEAKDGPRLFSFMPVDRSKFNPKKWTREKFRLTLWCEHSRLPLPYFYGKESNQGVFEIELSHNWFRKAGPFLKLMTDTLSLILPVASLAVNLTPNNTAYKAIEEQLDFDKNVISAVIGEGVKIDEFMSTTNKIQMEYGGTILSILARGAALR